MTDVFYENKRSEIMSHIKGRDTQPEKIVRSILHRMGYRFRIHKQDLPGTPDIVLPKHHKVIFVHGCLWHQHPNCPRASRPKSNKEFWDKKLDENISRDLKNNQLLSGMGWSVCMVWSCEIRDKEKLKQKLSEFMNEIPGKDSTGTHRAIDEFRI